MSVRPSLVYGSQSEELGTNMICMGMLTFEICLCIIRTSTDMDMDT